MYKLVNFAGQFFYRHLAIKFAVLFIVKCITFDTCFVFCRIDKKTGIQCC